MWLRSVAASSRAASAQKAARALQAALDRLPLADATQLYRAIGTELSQTMGGSSGVLLAIFFAAAGDASASGKDWIGALSACQPAPPRRSLRAARRAGR